ncbi:MAG TPA: MFS transporter [Actinotalea sp.]
MTVGMVTLVVLNAFEALAVTTTMPAVVRALGGLSLYAMAFAGTVASSVVGMVAAGMWSDRRGAGRPLLTGVGLFCLGLVVVGTAPSMVVVVVGRVVQGLGSGLISVALYVVVAHVYPARTQPRVFAAFAAAWVVPSVVGPAVAGFVAEHLGWRWVFLGIPLLAVGAVATLRQVLVQSAEARPGDVVDPDQALSRAGGRVRLTAALGAGLGAMALHWGGRQSGVAQLVTLALGAAALAVSVPRLLPPGTTRVARGLPSVVVSRGLFGAAFFGAEVYLPLLLIEWRGMSQAGAGLALAAAAILWSLGSSLRGRREGRWDDARVLRTGGLSLMVGIACAALGVWPAVPVAVSLLGWGLSGFGMGLAYPTLSVLTLRLSAPHEQGTNSSALQVNESLTIAVVLAAGAPLFAALVEGSPQAAFLVCFGLAAAAAAGAALVAGRVSPRPARIAPAVATSE